jgi:Protein of unknown function (DUF642)
MAVARIWAWFDRSGKKRQRITSRRLRLESCEDRSLPSTVTLGDAGFESAAVSVGSFKYLPTGSSWAFGGSAGVASNGSAFTSGNPNAPQGGQVAFLQSAATVSQAASFDAGTYIITFNAAQRSNAPSLQTFQVLIDGKTIGSFNNLTGAAYTQQSTTSFTATAGSHTITFQGTNLYGGDNTAFIDQVAVTAQTTPLMDSGFELPLQNPGSFQYVPAGSSWTFTGSSGITANGSGFTSGNPVTPQGSQAAFIQSLGTFRQTLTLTAGSYAIGFSAAQRANFVSGETFQVLVDGVTVGAFNSLTGAAYAGLTTSSFNVTAGSHIVTFQGTNLNGGDNTVFIDQVSITQQTSGLGDSGFELPTLAPGTFKYNPTGSPWTFSGSAGVTGNASGFTSGNPYAPQGSQVAFLQQTATISEPVNFTAGTYAISFSAAQRGNATSYQTFQVLFDGKSVGSFNSLGATSYVPLITSSFAATAGGHTVAFQSTNLNGGDNTVFIDQVAIAQQATSLFDSGLESPVLAPGTFRYNPTGSSWTFAGAAGVASDGSSFTSGNGVAPQGSQVAFLQQLGSISQVMTFTAGTYAISFFAAQRANVYSAQTFQVLVDGKSIGQFNYLADTAYSPQATSSFTVPAGNHTVTFQSTNINGGDNTVFIDQIAVVQQPTSLADSGFEASVVNPGGYKYNPTGSSWTFSGTAGITTSGSDFTSGNANAPQGGQAAFLQNTSSFSQAVNFIAGNYAISFAAAQRANFASNQSFQVLIDGNLIGSYDGLTGAQYNLLSTIGFSATAGSHTIAFQGTNLHGGDNTAFIDAVTVHAV